MNCKKAIWTNPGLSLLMATAFFVACSSDHTPKPTGYFQIDLPDTQYELFSDYPQFEFQKQKQVTIEKTEESGSGEWFKLNYPSLNAHIYCSYISVKNDPEEIQAESEQFVSFHIQRAESVKESTFENTDDKVYGTIYRLEGKNPSPIQFVLTDNTNMLFKGALYFESAINRDSIAPIIDYINNNIEVLIESFRWK